MHNTKNNVMISLCDGIYNRFDPLGARCIMGLIGQNGGQFNKLLQDRLLSRQQIIDEAVRDDPFAIWISVQPETHELTEFITAISQRYTGPIIIGNVGARGLLTQELAALRQNIVVVLGQGEDATYALFNLLKKDRKFIETDLIKVTNLRYYSLEQNKLIETQTSPSKLSKTTIPSSLQLAEAIARDDVITVRSSSGCHFSCVFCTVRDINNKQRWIGHSEKILKAHLSMIVENGKKHGTVRFVDDDLASDIANVQVVANTFNEVNQKYGGELTFGFATRASHLANHKDSETDATRRMKIWKNAVAAGLESIFLGLESGSSSQLKRLGKSMKAIYNFKATAIAQSLGVNLEIGFIPIDPFMNTDSWRNEMRDNIKLARFVGIAKTCPTWLAPMRAYEGSPMVTWLKKLNLLRDRIGDTDEYHYDYVSQEVAYFTKLLGPSFCSGKNNGLYDLKREIKYAQWYPCGLDKLIEDNCDAIMNAEITFVENLLDIDLYSNDAVAQSQLLYINVLDGNIRELKTKLMNFRNKVLTIKILECCNRALNEIANWKQQIMEQLNTNYQEKVYE